MRIMFTTLMMVAQITVAVLMAAAQARDPVPFRLSTPDATAVILASPNEPECVLLAAEDLAGDVERITGR